MFKPTDKTGHQPFNLLRWLFGKPKRKEPIGGPTSTDDVAIEFIEMKLERLRKAKK